MKEALWEGYEIDSRRLAVAHAYEQLLDSLANGTAVDFGELSDDEHAAEKEGVK